MPSDTDSAASLLTWRRIALWPSVFLAILFTAHYLALYARRFVWFDCPPNWPFNVYNPRGPHAAIEFAAVFATVALGAASIELLSRRGFRPAEVAVSGALLILLSNAIQGVPKGFYNPIAGGRSHEQYYHDAQKVTDAAGFLRNFAAIQPTLRTHARTHPPGAVLVFYAMRRLFGDRPAWMAIAISLAATWLSAWAFPRFARSLLQADDRTASYGTLLYLCLPAVEIYYCATLDALIAAILLAAVALWAEAPTAKRTILASLLVTAASTLTFGFIWVLPVLLVLDFVRQKPVRWLLVVLTLAVTYFALFAIFGFNYLGAGRMASHLENPRGYRLLVEPISFGFTRVEDVTEIAVFFGPFLLLYATQGFAKLREASRANPLGYTAFLAAVGTLAALFLTGAYHTGETARACLFIYAPLLLPVLAEVREATERQRRLLLYLVLAQAVMMQSTGNFFW